MGTLHVTNTTMFTQSPQYEANVSHYPKLCSTQTNTKPELPSSN